MTTTAPTSCLGRAPREGARLRLFCFHHAGGGASFFSSWPGRLPFDVDVLPVQLPGREARYREPRFQDAGEVVEALGRELAPRLDEGPWAAYGHSMGAMVAFALTAARLRAGGRPPEALFLGAYAAPYVSPSLPPPDRYDDHELARLLVDFGGLSPRFLGRDDWLRVLLPILRDDLRVCATHHRAGLPDPDDERARLPLHVEAFAGVDDPLVTPGAVRAWGRYVNSFRMTTVPGGHFFPRQAPDPFFDRLSPSLARLLAGLGGPPSAPG
ncbi:thioesterase [Streptomyces cyaneochromogenes]|uniref:Thioesterase n=1 Tax=Streptomyces cyaneochromogenes TaxID=2496836 RepID=A0A3Q9ELG8_9ACTN|nr:thioesterase domain-containing protein [Streptomyces cyaneochromogenes]AZQ33039.1 thioesterase [Streptomyces cyaneochromogenes]